MKTNPRRLVAERRVEIAERLIPASSSEIFRVLTDIRRHAAIDGSGMLRGEPKGPQQLSLGSRFTMAMQQRGAGYRSVNRVVEFAENELIAWETVGEFRGRKLIGGQRWRFELIPQGSDTLVRHSYVWGYANLPLLTIRLPGFPAKMRSAMAQSLANLEQELTEAKRQEVSGPEDRSD